MDPTTAWVLGLRHGLSLSKRLLRSAKFRLLPHATVKGMVSGLLSKLYHYRHLHFLGNVKNREASWKLLLTLCHFVQPHGFVNPFQASQFSQFRKLQMKQANDHKIN